MPLLIPIHSSGIKKCTSNESNIPCMNVIIVLNSCEREKCNSIKVKTNSGLVSYSVLIKKAFCTYWSNETVDYFSQPTSLQYHITRMVSLAYIDMDSRVKIFTRNIVDRALASYDVGQIPLAWCCCSSVYSFVHERGNFVAISLHYFLDLFLIESINLHLTCITLNIVGFFYSMLRISYPNAVN